MTLQPHEKAILEGYLKSFTDNLNMSLCFHLCKMIISDDKERDELIFEITQHYVKETSRLLDGLSKDNILLKSTCVDSVKNVSSQFISTKECRDRLFGITPPAEDNKEEGVDVSSKENQYVEEANTEKPSVNISE